MNIRPATLNDTASLLFLRQERQVLLQQSDPRLTVPLTPDDEFSALLANPNCRVMVGEVDERVVGYGTGLMHRYASHTLPPNIGLIAELTLDAHKYYGGLGRGLLNALRHWFQAQNADQIMVRVARYHAVEQAFWRSLGATGTPDSLFEISPALVWMRLI